MKWMLILLVVLLALLLLLFVLVFIVFPIVFMNCIALQRLVVFWNMNVPKNPIFQRPYDYGFVGIHNFYITSRKDMNSEELISLGAYWVPNDKYKHSNETMDEILAKNEFPVVLYNHGVASTRILKQVYGYGTLRKTFHVVAIDYRRKTMGGAQKFLRIFDILSSLSENNLSTRMWNSMYKDEDTDFGDSTPIDLSEEGVVIDVVHTYNLMKSKTKSDIYIWGHSLGGGISAHAVKWLKDNFNEIPGGLVIESSFTSLQDEVYEFPLGKFFSWLPWFKWCAISPLRSNGFIFNTTENAQDVDCPIMMMHAEDDNVIPFSLGEKNYRLISDNRKPRQGEVIFHPFAAEKKYQHIGCLQDPDATQYILQFIEVCKKWRETYDL